jgi:multiple antibiotic resistance protein
MERTTMIGAAEIFTIFFVTLGPLKIIGPFAQRTRALDERAARQIALRAFILATLAAVVGSFLGRGLLEKWHVTLAAMTIAAGIIFLLVALRQLLEQYEGPHSAEPTELPASPLAAAIRMLFPVVLTPYGIAAVIILLAASPDAERTVMILGLLVAVMVLNLLAMMFARRILVGFARVVLQVLGAVLGVMQLGLAVQFILAGLQQLGVIHG